MNTPFEDGILVMKAAISLYITENKRRSSQNVNCFQFKAWVRQGYDRELAKQKLVLSENIIYTLEQLLENYQKEMSRLNDLPADQRAKLAYMEVTKGFARLKDCIESGIKREKDINQGWTGSGVLARSLLQCQQHFDAYWGHAKEQIWQSPLLRGQLFEYNEVLKDTIFSRFDKDLDTNRHQFTSIMTRPEEMDEVSLSMRRPIAKPEPVTQAMAPPPAYGSRDDSMIEIKAGGSVLRIHQQ